MRFTINLATRTYLDHALLNRGMVCVLLVLVGLSAWKIIGFCGNLGKLERLKDDIAAQEAKLASRPAGISRQTFDHQRKTIRFFNEVIGRKTVNWLAFLEELEQVTPEGIALASLVPDTKTDTLKIEGRARNFGQVRSYMERLGDSKGFKDVLLLSHGDLAVGDKQHGIRFTISCQMVK